MEMVRVIKVISKLNGTEDEQHIAACGASHMTLRENGLLMTSVIYNRQGKPDSIEAFWKISPASQCTESDQLPQGQRFVLIPKPMYDMLVHEKFSSTEKAQA